MITDKYDFIQISVDPARFNSEPTTWLALSGDKFVSMRSKHVKNTVDIVNQTLEFKSEFENSFDVKVSEIRVNTVGIGACVFDHLKESCNDLEVDCNQLKSLSFKSIQDVTITK